MIEFIAFILTICIIPFVMVFLSIMALPHVFVELFNMLCKQMNDPFNEA